MGSEYYYDFVVENLWDSEIDLVLEPDMLPGVISHVLSHTKQITCINQVLMYLFSSKGGLWMGV